MKKPPLFKILTIAFLLTLLVSMVGIDTYKTFNEKDRQVVRLVNSMENLTPIALTYFNETPSKIVLKETATIFRNIIRQAEYGTPVNDISDLLYNIAFDIYMDDLETMCLRNSKQSCELFASFNDSLNSGGIELNAHNQTMGYE